MKKLILSIIVLVLLGVPAVPAFAAGGPGRRNAGNGEGPRIDNFSLAGTITAIDSQARTVTVLVLAGNRLVRPYLGQEIVISTQENTRYLLRTDEGCIPISFDDLPVDQNISVWGQKLPEVWSALRVTVGPELQRLQP